MREFPKRDQARVQVNKISEALVNAQAELTALKQQQADAVEKNRESAALQYLNDGKINLPVDKTVAQAANLQAVIDGLQVELERAKVFEDRAFLVDLQEWAGEVQPEVHALVERGQALRAELKGITGRLRILHQDSRLVSDWWGRAVSRIRASEQGAPSPCTNRPLPTKPPMGTIPSNLLNE
ncbi:MAG: hypothetical protein GXY07_01615 [Candidatus Hydrogenedentes bacterium]|nr:hypothetical protein [Candidatus Hydrogenedentota bacterium]